MPDPISVGVGPSEAMPAAPLPPGSSHEESVLESR